MPKAALKERLAKVFLRKPEDIALFGLHGKFGGGRSTGFALVYDSAESRKKYDAKTLLRRDGLWDGAKKNRKQGKEVKGRVKRVRGTAKAKAAAASGKKQRK